MGPKRSPLLLFRVAVLVHSSVGLAHATVAGRGAYAAATGEAGTWSVTGLSTAPGGGATLPGDAALGVGAPE